MDGSRGIRSPVSRPDCPEIVAPFGDIADFSTPFGDVFVANLGGPNPSNGDIEALVLIEDWSGTPAAVGEWTIAVRGEEIGEAGTYHGWLGEDSQVGSVPPYLSGNADNRFLVGKPGGAYHATTVGAYADHDAATLYRTSWIDVNGGSRVDTTAVVGDISDFSSPGPTRDVRTKPELAAPGERTLGAVSRDAYPTTAPHSIYRFHPFPDPEALIVDRSANHAFGLLQGTSFSAPVVTGLAARVLSASPGLDAVQVRNVLVNAAVADAFTGAVPNEEWGWGKASLSLGSGGGPLPSSLRVETLSFLEYGHPLLRPLLEAEDLRLAALEDIAAMKLAAVAQRGSKKDFVDVFALGRRFGLCDMLASYRKKYGVEDVGHVLVALAYFDDADRERTPMLLLRQSWPEMKAAIRGWLKGATGG